MSAVNVDSSCRCPVCGRGVMITEICIVCDGRDPARCEACGRTGELRTCANCGADYWKAMRTIEQQERR